MAFSKNSTPLVLTLIVERTKRFVALAVLYRPAKLGVRNTSADREKLVGPINFAPLQFGPRGLAPKMGI